MAEEPTTETDSGKKRIFILDDHPLVREWLVTLINQQPDLKICGEAGSAAEALGLIGTAKPHVAIVDISMEGGSGIEFIKNIKSSPPVVPEVAVIVLSMHDEALYCERALRAGARGYIMKREATKHVLQAIRRVVEGKLYLSEQMSKLLAEKYVEGRPEIDSLVEILSDRELEVFLLLGRGRNTRQIAEEMDVNFRTVQAFCSRIKEKLKLANATDLLRAALRWHDSQQNK